MSGDRVLLVDDEEEFTRALAERMEARGLRVETAADGEAAVARAAARSFDAIVLDLSMPGLSGIETLRRLRESSPEVQVILLTGHATVQTGVEAMRLGALDFVEKPADLEQLLERIGEASARKAILVERRAAEEIKEILAKKPW
ncbi:MAG: response regulator [Deltaproteobacteria bacterium]|nr:response regulator [Deltaproteobacteria bacterium]